MTAHTPAARRARAARRLDLMIRATVAITVAVLALVSGAISFDHMHLLASAHHQTGWRAGAFPVSVDGLELVASLVILADHRERGSARSVLPWVALATGTGASLAANIAVGAPHDLIGRAISGWPAVALLVTLKLAAGRLTGPARSGIPVRSERSAMVLNKSGWPAVGPDPSGGGVLRSDPDEVRSAMDRGRSVLGTDGVPDHPTAELIELVAHARRVCDTLRDEGVSLTRRELATRLRAEGHPVSNGRMSVLLRVLRADSLPETSASLPPEFP